MIVPSYIVQPPLGMNVKEFRATVLRNWFALAPEQRATRSQAAIFADQAMQVRGMAATEVSVATIKGWLERYTGLNPIF